MITGPPPKFHGTRDILSSRRQGVEAISVQRAVNGEPHRRVYSAPARPAGARRTGLLRWATPVPPEHRGHGGDGHLTLRWRCLQLCHRPGGRRASCDRQTWRVAMSSLFSNVLVGWDGSAGAAEGLRLSLALGAPDSRLIALAVVPGFAHVEDADERAHAVEGVRAPLRQVFDAVVAAADLTGGQHASLEFAEAGNVAEALDRYAGHPRCSCCRRRTAWPRRSAASQNGPRGQSCGPDQPVPCSRGPGAGTRRALSAV